MIKENNFEVQKRILIILSNLCSASIDSISILNNYNVLDIVINFIDSSDFFVRQESSYFIHFYTKFCDEKSIKNIFKKNILKYISKALKMEGNEMLLNYLSFCNEFICEYKEITLLHNEIGRLCYSNNQDISILAKKMINLIN